jgi:hypothetical protein
VSSEATPSDPDDEIFNKAEVRFSAELARRPEVLRAAAWRGNWAVGLFAGDPETPFPVEDRVIVTDSRTNRRVLKRGTDPEIVPGGLLTEISKDLKALLIRQFRTKCDIPD